MILYVQCMHSIALYLNCRGLNFVLPPKIRVVRHNRAALLNDNSTLFDLICSTRDATRHSYTITSRCNVICLVGTEKALRDLIFRIKKDDLAVMKELEL